MSNNTFHIKCLQKDDDSGLYDSRASADQLDSCCWTTPHQRSSIPYAHTRAAIITNDDPAFLAFPLITALSTLPYTQHRLNYHFKCPNMTITVVMENGNRHCHHCVQIATSNCHSSKSNLKS